MRVLFAATLTIACAATPPPPCPCAVAPAPSPSCPASASSVAEAPPVSEPPKTCGQLALYEARLVASGKGDKHPLLMDVRARLAQCTDRQPSAADCLDVREKGIELSKVYGPKHPERVINAAMQAVCDQYAAQPPPPPFLPKGSCGPGTTMCGSGEHAACCGPSQMCCAGGAAGSYYCKSGKGACPPLP